MACGYDGRVANFFSGVLTALRVTKGRMLLAEFIGSRSEAILVAWEAFARTLLPGVAMDTLALRDHAPDILRATVRDMRLAKEAAEGPDAARRPAADPADGLAPPDGAADDHAVGRLSDGFSLMEVVSEYRALRASVLRLWRGTHPALHDSDVDDLARFNESLDQSMAKAVACYTRRVDQSRDMFLAILSHDLRNPLNSIAMSAALLPSLSDLPPESVETATQITTSATVMERMISDLLDYTRTRLGAGLPVSPEALDVGVLCRAVYHEFRTAHPKRTIRYRTDGDLSADGDDDRLRQAISNLMGNAVQHGDPAEPVELSVAGDEDHVLVAVRNGGPAIPPAELPKIFQPLVRGAGTGKPRRHRPGSIGLGLYIAREIALSHAGKLDVTSTDAGGTTFTLRLPRHTPASAGPILDQLHIQAM